MGGCRIYADPGEALEVVLAVQGPLFLRAAEAPARKHLQAPHQRE